MRNKRKWIVLIPVLIVILAVIGGELVQQLWNRLLPGLFGWRQITFWQALGLLALCRILFGGLGRGHHRSNYRRRMFDHWERMTPEEREKFRQGMRAHGGGDAEPDNA